MSIPVLKDAKKATHREGGSSLLKSGREWLLSSHGGNVMSKGENKSPFGGLAVVGLCGLCCAIPVILIGGGGAAIAGFFGDNLGVILVGAAVLGGGIFLLASRRKAGDR